MGKSKQFFKRLTPSLIIAPHNIFLIIALVIGVTFVRTIPPLWGVDEPTHFARAYQMSTGRLSEVSLPNGTFGGYLPSPLGGLKETVNSDLLDNARSPFKEVDDKDLYNNLKNEPLGSTKIAMDFTGSGVYSPVAYAAPSVGIAIARAIHSTVGSVIFGARFATLLVYIAIVYVALFSLRRSRTVWLVFTISLLPTAIFQASIVNVDSLAIALSLLLFSQLIRLWQLKPSEIDWRRLSLLAVAAAALPLSKPNYMILSFLAPALLFFKLASTSKKRIYFTVGLLIFLMLPAAAWNLHVHGLISGGALGQRPDVHLSVSGQAHYIVSHPAGFLTDVFKNAIYSSWYQQSIGILGFNFVLVPEYVQVILTFGLVIAGLASVEKRISKVACLAVIIVALFSALSILTTLYLTYTPVGSHDIAGIQGRYFLPILPFLLYGLFNIMPIKLQANHTYFRILLPALSLICLVGSFAWYFKVTY